MKGSDINFSMRYIKIMFLYKIVTNLLWDIIFPIKRLI